MDLFNGIASVVLGLRNEASLGRWARLIFSMTASYLLGFSTAMGAAIVAGQSGLIGFGYGLLCGSAMAFSAYLQMDKKAISGTVLVVPQRTTTDQFDNSTGPMVSKP